MYYVADPPQQATLESTRRFNVAAAVPMMSLHHKEEAYRVDASTT